MLDKIISFVLQQRLFVWLATASLIILGWRAVMHIPIEAFPDVEDVHVQIVTQAPGQGPEEVERSITLPIEKEMSGVPHLTQLRSVSITGLSVVTLTFSERTDDYFARAQVLEKLQGVNLPPDAQPTLAPLSTAVGEIYRYVLDAPASMPRRELRAIQDWTIRPQLRQVTGVADVVSFGGALKEYQIHIDPHLLTQYGITLDDVAQALSNGSGTAGGGLVKRGEEAMVVRGLGLFRNVSDIEHVVVKTRHGTPVYVSDLGKVTIGDHTRSGIVAFNKRDDVIEGIVSMTKGQNPAMVIAELRQKVEQINHELPQGVKIVPFYDRTNLIRHTVHTVSENLVVGAGLVLAILIVFLRNWRGALIVASVIPLSLLFAFVLMDAMGVSANLISLGSVDFGIIIDSAVVLVEALMVRMAAATLHEGVTDPYGARLHVLKTTTVSLAHPILFSKAIIILAFLPIFTFQRVEGKIFSPMAYTLSFALLGAVLLTLTWVPSLLTAALRSTDISEKPVRWLERLTHRYKGLLVAAQRHRVRVGVASLALLGTSLALIPLLGSEFLPKLDEGNIWLTVSLPPSTALEKTKEIERQIRSILASYPEVDFIVTQVGRPDDGTDPKGPNNLEILADLKPKSQWRFPDKESLVADMTGAIQKIPGVPTNFSQVIQDNVEEALSGVKGEIAVKIFGPDLGVLEQKGAEIAAVLRRIPGAADVAAIGIGGQAELDLTLDRERMARLGLNVGDVNRTIGTALAGTPVNAFYEGDRRFDVALRFDAPFRSSVDEIRQLPVAAPASSQPIPLESIANVDLREGASRIGREAGSRIVAVKANLLGRDQGSFVAEAMRAVQGKVHLPPGYRLTWGGQFENQRRAMKRLEFIVPLSLALIFLLLFWAFKSVRLALLVLLMIPFTLIGGLGGLALAGLHLSVSAAVGFIAVAGISVQNGVIMVEQVADLVRNGASWAHAVTEGAAVRLRPILMTALMAGTGLLPAALSHGIGSETQRPFAVVIVGGIVSATLATVILLPLLLWRPEKVPAAGERLAGDEK